MNKFAPLASSFPRYAVHLHTMNKLQTTPAHQRRSATSALLPVAAFLATTVLCPLPADAQAAAGHVGTASIAAVVGPDGKPIHWAVSPVTLELDATVTSLAPESRDAIRLSDIFEGSAAGSDVTYLLARNLTIVQTNDASRTFALANGGESILSRWGRGATSGTLAEINTWFALSSAARPILVGLENDSPARLARHTAPRFPSAQGPPGRRRL